MANLDNIWRILFRIYSMIWELFANLADCGCNSVQAGYSIRGLGWSSLKGVYNRLQ